MYCTRAYVIANNAWDIYGILLLAFDAYWRSGEVLNEASLWVDSDSSIPIDDFTNALAEFERLNRWSHKEYQLRMKLISEWYHLLYPITFYRVARRRGLDAIKLTEVDQIRIYNCMLRLRINRGEKSMGLNDELIKVGGERSPHHIFSPEIEGLGKWREDIDMFTDIVMGRLATYHSVKKVAIRIEPELARTQRGYL
jgi:hypothetical protein